VARAAVVLVDGFEEIEAVTVIDVLRRANVDVALCGVVALDVVGSHGIALRADRLLRDVGNVDVVVLPGGMPGAATLRDSDVVRAFVEAQHARGALLAAICAAPIALASWGLLRGRSATCFPGHKPALVAGGATVLVEPVVDAGNVVTSRGVGTALAFALALVARLVDDDTAARLARTMLVG
jgi:4-methyl-5(b-hydroxyethyl)-thiazole monophosphate biosynthesis